MSTRIVRTKVYNTATGTSDTVTQHNWVVLATIVADSGWTYNATINAYTQTISGLGTDIEDNDIIYLSLDIDETQSLSTINTMLEEYNKIYKVVFDNGNLIFYAKEATNVDMTINATIQY